MSDMSDTPIRDAEKLLSSLSLFSTPVKKDTHHKTSDASRMSLRTLRGSSTSISTRRRSDSIHHDQDGTKFVRFLPTYRLDPKVPFKHGPVHRIVKLVVDAKGKEMGRCDATQGPRACLTVVAAIRTAVRNLDMDRFKLCIVATAGERRLQGYMAAAKCLWDVERDGWASHTFQTQTYFLSCVCFCQYHD